MAIFSSAVKLSLKVSGRANTALGIMSDDSSRLHFADVGTSGPHRLASSSLYCHWLIGIASDCTADHAKFISCTATVVIVIS